jgi:hypothetical protein
MSQKYRRVTSSNTASLRMLNRTRGQSKKNVQNEKYEDMIYEKRVELRKLYEKVYNHNIQIVEIEDNLRKNNKVIETMNNTQNMSKTMSINNPSMEYSTSNLNKKILKMKEENSKLEDTKLTLSTEMNHALKLIGNIQKKIKKLNNKLSISHLSLGGKKKRKYTKKNNK